MNKHNRKATKKWKSWYAQEKSIGRKNAILFTLSHVLYVILPESLTYNEQYRLLSSRNLGKKRTNCIEGIPPKSEMMSSWRSLTRTPASVKRTNSLIICLLSVNSSKETEFNQKIWIPLINNGQPLRTIDSANITIMPITHIHLTEIPSWNFYQ